MSQQLFRKVALERMSSPEQLDTLMQVTAPRSWLALLGLTSLLIIAVVWGFVGRIPTELSSSAILLYQGGIKNIVSQTTGQVMDLSIRAGDVVNQGEVIAEIGNPAQDMVTQILSPYDGRILELKAAEGGFVTPGGSLASLEFAGTGAALEALLYLPSNQSVAVRPGMPVRITLTNSSQAQVVHGLVASVGQFPASYAGILNQVGSEELALMLATHPQAVEVRVALAQPAPGQEPLRSGLLGSAAIVIGEQRPIELVLPVR